MDFIGPAGVVTQSRDTRFNVGNRARECFSIVQGFDIRDVVLIPFDEVGQLFVYTIIF